MKCSLCNQKIETTFLDKILGTYFKDAKGKRHAVCVNCQRKHRNDKEAILKALKDR